MAKFDLKEIRKMDRAEILSLIKDKQVNLTIEKMSSTAQKKLNYLLVRKSRKEIAILNTVIKEKEIING